MRKLVLAGGLTGLALSGGVMVGSCNELASHSSELRQVDACGSFLSRVKSEDMTDDKYSSDFYLTAGRYDNELRREGTLESLRRRENAQNYFFGSCFCFAACAVAASIGYMIYDGQRNV